ncbi:uncharacterized protein LOC141849909 [Brevipalpus obovatus]|uniref:uncharacterized protein LOC141849909 n=1 Tax=Brevipalpus obovatus TaxID=246614 RepID=UPI003D9F39B7
MLNWNDDQKPRVTELMPDEGGSNTEIRIYGRNLGQGPEDIVSLFICNEDCTDTIKWISSKEIKARTKKSESNGDVILTTKSGGVGTCSMQFRGTLPKSIGCGKRFSDEGKDALDSPKMVSFWLHRLTRELIERLKDDQAAYNRIPKMFNVSASLKTRPNISISLALPRPISLGLIDAFGSRYLIPKLFDKDGNIIDAILLLSISASKFVEKSSNDVDQSSSDPQLIHSINISLTDADIKFTKLHQTPDSKREESPRKALKILRQDLEEEISCNSIDSLPSTSFSLFNAPEIGKKRGFFYRKSLQLAEHRSKSNG